LIYTTFLLQDYLEYFCYSEMHLNTGWLCIFLLYFLTSVKLPSLFPFQYAAFNIFLSERYLFFLHIAAHFYSAVIYTKLLSKLAAIGVNLESSFWSACCKISVMHCYFFFFFLPSSLTWEFTFWLLECKSLFS